MSESPLMRSRPMGTCTSCLGLREKLVDGPDRAERVEFPPQGEQIKLRSCSEKLQGEDEEEGCIGIMEKKMETALVYWSYIGIMERKMETTIVY